MKVNPLKEWTKFKDVFSTSLKNLNSIQLKRLAAVNDRKYFWGDTVFPQIASELGYIFKLEFLRVDYSLLKKANNEFNIPMICIESENNYDSTYEEALKLAAINAPLKILIIYGMPEDRLKDFKDNDINDHYILQDYIEVTQLVGWYVVMAYDDTENAIRFHCFVYDENGVRIPNESIVLKIR